MDHTSCEVPQCLLHMVLFSCLAVSVLGVVLKNEPLWLNELAYYDRDDNKIIKQIPLDAGLSATA